MEDLEKECRQICDRLSVIENNRIKIEMQFGGHVEVTGVYRRFFGWYDAKEYLIGMLEAAEFNRSLEGRKPYSTFGTKAPRKTRGPAKKKD